MNVCRACKRKKLMMFLPLGLHPLAQNFLNKNQLNKPEYLCPLDTYVCLSCGLIQVCDCVPPDYFRNYLYVSSTINTMLKHFSDFADSLAAEFGTSPDLLTVDIGCNDGLLLKSLDRKGVKTLGVDPARNVNEIVRREGLNIINEYFASGLATKIKKEYGSAAVIVTANTFHHISDLDSFMDGVCILLKDKGVFIVEVPHAMEIMEQNEFDGIYHEHVSQFTVKSMVDLCNRFDMEVFRIDTFEVHGGSMRFFIRRKESDELSEAISEWITKENKRGLFQASTYEAFHRRVKSMKVELMDLLRRLKQEGNNLVGYGASARGNTLLNYYGIGTDLMDYIVDRNTLKHGLYSPGMHIPVCPVEKILKDRPDYVLALAWNFSKEIIKQQEEYLSLGGKFILPIPELSILEHS